MDKFGRNEQIPLRKGKKKTTGEGNEWKCSRPENGYKSDKVNTTWKNSRYEKYRWVNRNFRCKHHQENTTDRKEKLMY